ILSSPFKLGADLIVHATTKYLGGHSDVLGGIVIARERGPLFDRLRTIQTAGGAVPSPFDCWLVLRGIRTLPYRVRAQSEHALKVATFLDASSACIIPACRHIPATRSRAVRWRCSAACCRCRSAAVPRRPWRWRRRCVSSRGRRASAERKA